MNEELKKRAVVLLRASSKQQTDREHDFDIPQQKSILLPFVERRGWELMKVFTEGGVSGFKVSAANRDAIQDIKKMADNNEFDILVIYMSDRLGRIADETPLIVSYLNQRGITVFSYTEGEISAKDHTNKLITYIRYWQAEGESRKTSMRVSDAIGRSVDAGEYRGGAAPFGYKMVNNGRNNYKGKPVLDIEIDEEQAAVVREIFELAREKNYGYRQIAQYLNDKGYKTKKGGLWSCGTVGQVLYHTLYKGFYELKEKKGCRTSARKVSPLMPELVIIPEEEWNATHEAMKKRSNREKGTRNTTHGVMLLSGLLYCGYCQSKLTSFQSKSKYETIDGEKIRKFIAKYRCSSYVKPTADKCKGQATYSAKKIETVVVNAIKKYLATLSTQDLTVSYLERIDEEIARLKSDFTKKQIAQTRATKELSALKDEVIKSLVGESKFDSQMLQELLSKKEIEIKDGYLQLENYERQLDGLGENRRSVYTLDNRMRNWDADFEEQDTAGQKAMLYQVIYRINVYREKVEIHVRVKMDMFKEGLSVQTPAPDGIISIPIETGDEPLGIVAEQSNVGDVNSTSLAVQKI